MIGPGTVFSSHKSEHKPWVAWLAEALRTLDYPVFLDIWDLVPGASGHAQRGGNRLAPRRGALSGATHATHGTALDAALARPLASRTPEV